MLNDRGGRDRLNFDRMRPRTTRQTKTQALRSLQATIALQIDARLPFDELLRVAWSARRAAQAVCVDFLLQTLERAAGTWWRPREEPRERVIGGLDFDPFDRVALRRAPEFVVFARDHPAWFGVLQVPEQEQYPMRSSAFYAGARVASRQRVIGPDQGRC